MTSSHDHAALYERLGIDIGTLGAVLVNTKPLRIEHLIDPADLHVSENPARSWVRGAVAEHEAHVTLLFGLLSPMWTDWDTYRSDIFEVLDGWQPPAQLHPVKNDALTIFPSPYADEPYSCIVLKIDPAPLLEGHARLTLLPHIQTFTDYTPHLTLAYVKAEATERVAANLRAEFFWNGVTVETGGITAGSKKRWDRGHA